MSRSVQSEKTVLILPKRLILPTNVIVNTAEIQRIAISGYKADEQYVKSALLETGFRLINCDRRINTTNFDGTGFCFVAERKLPFAVKHKLR